MGVDINKEIQPVLAFNAPSKDRKLFLNIYSKAQTPLKLDRNYEFVANITQPQQSD
jgi:hypothetical protein